MNMAVRKSALLMAAMLIMTLWAGCSQGTGSNNAGSNSADDSRGPASSSQQATAGAEVVELTPPGEFPIVKEPVELTVLVGGDARIADMQTNAFSKWYEELTNVKVKYEVTPEGSQKEAFNLRMASNELPDIFMSMDITRAQEMIFGQQQAFLPLNDLIESQGYYIKEMFKARPQMYDAIKAPDGNIYSIPEVNECYHCSMAVKMWINQDFLNAVGMDMPQTTEQFYEVLKAFKEQDPNGNGKPDEIPLAGTTKSWYADVETFLMNSFVYTPPAGAPKGVYVKDGVIQLSFMQPGWKEGLKYLHRLYSEGLIAGESFTQDGQQLMQMGEHPEAPILGAFPGGYMALATEYMGESGRWKTYTAVPPLAGPDGTRQAVHLPYQFVSGKLVVTTATKYPEVALRWADGFFKEEVLLRANQGVPGVDWKEADPGMKGIDGRPAKWETIATYGEVSDTQWYQRNPGFLSNEFRLSMAAGENPSENLEVILYNETHEKYEPYKAPVEMALPPLFFKEEESMELADLEKTIGDYVDQMTARFIIGDASIDEEWDTYLRTLQSMNVERYRQIYQDSYDSTRK